MRDLVRELRQVEREHKAFALCYEAADEVERLRREIDRLTPKAFPAMEPGPQSQRFARSLKE